MEERITPGQWYALGLYTGPSPAQLAPMPGVDNPVLTYRDVDDARAIFVADPFLLRHQGLWFLFFEVFNDATYRGEISLASSADLRRWDYRGKVLAEPFHLSYPHVFAWQGEIYMLPETFGEDCVRLYRAEAFPHDWRPMVDLIQDGPAADPTLFHHDGAWWLFTCPRPETHDVLRLYHAPELMGPWREHPASPIVDGDPRTARPAGRVVRWGPSLSSGSNQQSLVRYAQDCHPQYGSAVRAFEITRLTATEYRERPLGSPIADPAPGAWNSRGRHHVDAHQLADGSWIAVIDGHDHPSYRI
jgi:hypothetical protein